LSRWLLAWAWDLEDGADVVSGAGLDVVHQGGEKILLRGGVAGCDGVADAAPQRVEVCRGWPGLVADK
jgi:hypothetical protein